MINSLTPGVSKVGVGNIFYVAMTGPNGELESRHFIAVQAFNYADILEEIRQEGIVKSEEVTERFCEVVLERELVWKADTCVLNVGERGRASTALKEVGRYQYNTNHELLRAVVRELEVLCLTIEGRKGDLHLLKVETGETLAQVRIFLDDGEALAEQVTLDLIGPPDYPLPNDLDDVLGQAISKYLYQQYPKLQIGITVRTRKSDLVLAKEAIHAPLRRRRSDQKYRRPAKH